MKNRWVILFVSLALIGGVVLGAWGAMKFGAVFDQTGAEDQLNFNVTSRITILKNLQTSNQAQAVLWLETFLDMDVISLSARLDHSDNKDALLGALLRVAEYRKSTNFVNKNKEIAAAVHKALAMAQAKEKEKCEKTNKKAP